MAEVTQQNPLGIRSIYENKGIGMWESYKQKLSLDWVFDKTYEKVILVVCFLWAVYSLFKVIGGLF